MASNPSKDKGNRGETLIKEALRKATGLPFERTPLSGALDAKHGLKSDLYLPNKENTYSIECKFYAEDHINSGILHHKSPQIIEWWEQAVHSATITSKVPLLIFKYNRSKLFAGFTDMPKADFNYMYINRPPYEFYVSLLEDWLKFNNPQFIK